MCSCYLRCQNIIVKSTSAIFFDIVNYMKIKDKMFQVFCFET